MSSEQARELRQRGIAAAKAGQNDQARQLLQQSLRLDPGSEAAWVWLASIARDRRERLFCFQKLLELNPQNETALKALQSMGITPEQLRGQVAQAQAQPSATTQAASTPQTPGVPLPDAQRITQAQQQVDEIVREIQRAPDRIDNIQWVRKSSQRAGERDALYLRLYVLGAIGGILLVAGIIGAIVLATSPDAQAAVFGASATPSFTPSLTPTNTPGFTPTPSPTSQLTLTPSPTVPPSIAQGLIDAPPAPTRIYPEVSNRFISDSVALLNAGQPAIALPTLVSEREAAEFSFNPSPYYYEALALLASGDPQGALSRIQEAESRLSETPGQNFKPLVDLGYAQVFYHLAARAFSMNSSQEGRGYLEQLESRARAAIEGDARLADAYLLLARRYQLVGNYSNALTILNEALGRSDLEGNVSLIVERGEVYFQQGEIDRAAQEAFLALYIDPTIEDAYLLQIKTALAQDDPGLAVIYAQNYLFFYPGSAEGYKLLGDARLAEGNTDLALTAYNQALAAEAVTPATVGALVARAALYRQQGRSSQARDDLSRAFTLSSDPEIRALRMQAAYNAGNYSVALEDADALTGAGVLSDQQLQFLRARILIDQADSPEDYTQARERLDAIGTGLPASLLPLASEYRARALYNLGDYTGALQSVDGALNAVETGSRHFLRGQILEGLNRPDEALREYEWVLTWGEIYPYPFLPQARNRVEALVG